MTPSQPPEGESPPRTRWKLSDTPPALRWLAAIFVALVTAVVVFCLLFQWNWLRGPLAGMISARLHRPVQITGDLEVHPWSFSPRSTVNGLVIGNPAWAGPEPMMRLPRLTVQVRLMPLLVGRVILPLVDAERPQAHLIRDAQDRANWTFGNPSHPEPAFRLPPIRHFVINDGHLRVNDARRRVTLVGIVTTNERSVGADSGAFTLRGQGSLNGQPFTASIGGAPLLNVSPDRAYPFTADVHAGATHVTARGSVPHPFDFGRFSTSLAITGPDASRLYYLTGLAFPNTPPYQISGAFSRDEREYAYRNFTGHVGDSDLSGSLTVNTQHRRPMLRADLSSRHLDFDDLAAIFGGAPATGRGETASPEQVVMANHLRAEGRLLPDAQLDTGRLRVMDADVRYRASSIGGSRIPVRSGSVHVRLNDGVLIADPLDFTLPQGRLAGSVQVNGRGAVPVTAVDLRLTNARLQDFMPASTNAPLQGGLFARARLTGSGASVRAAAATSDGQVTFVIPRGHIREAFAELLGVNATRGLFLLLTHDNSETNIRCAVANFSARNGILTANNIVFDTDVVIAHGRGTIDLRDESMNLRLEGRAKHFRLVRVMAPVTLSGPFTHLRPGIELSHAAGQVGIAAVLGAVINPLAALLPFVDPGLGHDANCAALISGARVLGLPVTAHR